MQGSFAVNKYFINTNAEETSHSVQIILILGHCNNLGKNINKIAK